jgi:hypothetical protein
MKRLIVALALLIALPVTAGPPEAVWMDVATTFDANRIASGTFTATGAISDQGTFVDTPKFVGAAIHLTRLLITAGGEYITIEINGNHVAGSNVPPTWCPAPPPVPGTVLVPEFGTWRIISGTGPYATLQGTGAWATWVTASGAFQPLSAKECLSGLVQYL